MRILFFFLLSLCLHNRDLFAQDETTRKPTRSEMQAQLKQARTETQQQIAEFEAQLADAKKNNEDLETIRELEKQVATMKKMAAMLEKVNPPGNADKKTLLPPKAEPRYVSPFVPIILKQAVSAPRKEQANDQLLWYSGRRIDANTLVTISGMVVQYQRAYNRVIVQPRQRVDTPDFYYGMINTLAQTQGMKSDFTSRMNGIDNSFFMFPEIKKAHDEFTFFRNRYYNIAKNVITIEKPRVIRTPRPDQALEAMHHELIIAMATLPSPYNIKLPPKRPNNLCSCDPQLREDYEDNLVNWLESQFWVEEEIVLHKLKAIYSQLDFRRQVVASAAAVIPDLKSDIINAFNTVIERITIKLEELNKKYEAPDIYIEEGLVIAALSFKKLLIQTISDISEASTLRLKSNAYIVIDRVENSIMGNTVFEKYMNEQKALLDFNVVFDYSLYLAHEYNKKLLSPLYQLNENFFITWVEGLKKFNRFTLTLNIDFSYDQVDKLTNDVLLTAIGKLESKRIIVSLGRSTCSWHLYPTDANHRDRSGAEEPFQIPIKVISGTKTINTKNGAITMDYSGPREMRMVFPTFEISFCPGLSQDKALMNVLRYSDADIQRHKNDKLGEVYTVDMQYYTDKMLLGARKTQTNVDEVIATAGEMMNPERNVPAQQSTGDQKMDQLLMTHVMEQRRRELQMSIARPTHTANTIFPFDALNKFPVLINKSHSTLDTNDEDKTWGMRFTLAFITLKVEHSPLP